MWFRVAFVLLKKTNTLTTIFAQCDHLCRSQQCEREITIARERQWNSLVVSSSAARRVMEVLSRNLNALSKLTIANLVSRRNMRFVRALVAKLKAHFLEQFHSHFQVQSHHVPAAQFVRAVPATGELLLSRFDDSTGMKVSRNDSHRNPFSAVLSWHPIRHGRQQCRYSLWSHSRRQRTPLTTYQGAMNHLTKCLLYAYFLQT